MIEDQNISKTMAEKVEPVEPDQSEYDSYEGYVDALKDYGRALQSALKRAQSQLPEGMKHCTIIFEECEKGHGHLRGDNWIKHDCLVCRAEKAESLYLTAGM